MSCTRTSPSLKSSIRSACSLISGKRGRAWGTRPAIEVLLRAGVSRDTRTKVDRTPLHVAAQEGHLDIVNLLIMHGADIDAKDLLRMTPLHWAVERGFTDIVEALLGSGADPECENKFDKTAIDIAFDSGRTDIIPLLQVSTRARASEERVTHSESRATRVPRRLEPRMSPSRILLSAPRLDPSFCQTKPLERPK